MRRHMIGGIVRGLGQRWRKGRLDLEWQLAKRAHKLDHRIPRPSINYNIEATSSLAQYQRCFVADACLKELPGLLEISRYRSDQPSFSMLDYGCGLGRMAYAFTNYFGATESRRYIGYEIHPEAYRFLREAYSEYPNVQFLTDLIDLRESYAELQQAATQSTPRASAEQLSLQGRIPVPIDLQFSHSVFTHMYRASIVHVLRELAKLMTKEGVCVNSWLLVDQFSLASMRAGLADRQLPHQVDGFYTYSIDNPLLCSAYPLHSVEEIYREAGHTIVSILFGGWSGRKAEQSLSTQDIIVSRPAK